LAASGCSMSSSICSVMRSKHATHTAFPANLYIADLLNFLLPLSSVYA